MIQTIGQIMMNMELQTKRQALRFRINNAQQTLLALLRQQMTNVRWLKGYDDIATWLSDNHSKGLLLQGGCGVGKTVIATRIIPYILDHSCNPVTVLCDARDINDKRLEYALLYNSVKIIDDIGTETERNDFGVRKDFLPDIVDVADKNGHLLILTTNLKGEQLLSRYGRRTVDRLRENCLIVSIDSESMRQQTTVDSLKNEK